MSKKNIPVCLPRLPLAENIFPYLQQIDANRWYSNFGPLHNEFSSRLAKLFNVSQEQIACGTTGTQLLELCLRALEIKPGSLCVMPAWTFVATPLAAASANLEPIFVDVDLDTQTLAPEKLLEQIPKLKQMGNIGAVMVTAPFGKPVDTLAWDNFTDLTGIPVVIDAAAAFDTMLQLPEMQVRNTPMLVSLHATKVFGIGEGGVLFSQNENLIQRIISMSQFGFTKGKRDSNLLGTNIKMSEYVCAVGLAVLDGWAEIRSEWQVITDHYRKAFKNTGIRDMLSADFISSTCNIIAPLQANALLQELDKQGVMTRKWWSDGCHHQPVFRNSLRGSGLNNTEFLQKSVLGVPFYLEMNLSVIDSIVTRLAESSKETICQ
jgi:dTDP-4-amino-4,6-dideoxygalactose transaminase